MRILLVVLLTAMLVACNSSVAPTGPRIVDPVTITVYAKRQVDQSFFEGVRVYHNGMYAGATNAQGLLKVPVPRGIEAQIDVEADGYIGFGVSGTPQNDETWTFYLERE